MARANLEKAMETIKLVDSQQLALDKQGIAGAKEELAKLLARSASVDASLQRIANAVPTLQLYETLRIQIGKLEAIAESLSRKMEEEQQRNHELTLLSEMILEAIPPK
jgi:hypothetical protein